MREGTFVISIVLLVVALASRSHRNMEQIIARAPSIFEQGISHKLRFDLHESSMCQTYTHVHSK